MSFVQSLFTPPGTSARYDQQGRQGNYASSVYSSLWPGLQQYLQNAQGFENSQYPNVEKGVQNAYYNTTQGGRDSETGAYGAQQQAMARQEAGSANSQFAGNTGLAQGFKLDAANRANENTGQYAAGVNSPQGQQSAWNNYMGRMAQAAPNYGGLGAMDSAIYGQPTAQVGQGLGGFLGTALGSYFGGPAGGAAGSALAGGGTNQGPPIDPGIWAGAAGWGG